MTRVMAPDLAEFYSEDDELKARRDFMVSRGYRFCSIMACNCNSWHGGHAERRLEELDDLLRDYGIDRRRPDGSSETLSEVVTDLLLTAGYTNT